MIHFTKGDSESVNDEKTRRGSEGKSAGKGGDSLALPTVMVKLIVL